MTSIELKMAALEPYRLAVDDDEAREFERRANAVGSSLKLTAR